MDTFPSNSQKAKVASEPKKIERVTSAEARPRKRGLGRRFKEAFIGGDARTATEDMVTGVIIPSIQDMVIDALQGGIERVIKGETAHSPRRSGSGGYPSTPHINYQSQYQGANRPGPPQRSAPPRTLSRSSRSKGAFDELIIPSKHEAEEVLERMFDILARYGAVSVADLYEMTGIQSNHTDMKWGWFDLRGARSSRQRSGGFLLDLPQPEPLD